MMKFYQKHFENLTQDFSTLALHKNHPRGSDLISIEWDILC